MQDKQSYDELNEKSLEIILNFKPNEKYDKSAVNELQLLKDKVKKAISILPDNEKKILELRYFHNLSKDLISTQLGRNKEEITNVLNNGIKGIKKSLKEGISQVEKKDTQIQQNANMQNVRLVPRWYLITVVLIFIIVFALTFWVVYLFVSNITKPEVLNQIGEVISNFSVQQGDEEKIVKRTTPKSMTNKIRISGSTSLLELSKKWKNSFTVDHSEYKVFLVPSDSESGIKSLINGKVEIANSSRPISHSEERKANQNGFELVENRVALDALAIIVNIVNPIQELSLEDLEKIFNGEIQNWNSLIDFNKPLSAVVREKGSGTNDFVLGRVLQNIDFPGEPLRKESNKEIFDYISQNEGAISFINSNNFPWYNKKIKFVKIKTYLNSIPISPFIAYKLNEQAIRYGDYPLAHYLYLITANDSSEGVRGFIDWVLSPKGQEIVEKSGLLPIKSFDE